MNSYIKILKENLADMSNVKVRMNAAAAVIYRIDENDTKQVLLIQRASDDHWPNHYEFPRGKCDKGNSNDAVSCVKREVKEETGLDINVVGLIDKFQYLADQGKRLTTCFNYLCEMVDPNQKVKLSNEHQDYKWVSEIGQVEMLLLPDQKKTIEKVLNTGRSIVSYPENDFTKNNKIEEAISVPDGFSEINIVVRDPDNQLIRLLDYISKLSAPGHSFGVIVDPDSDDEQQFGIDGDGSFYIKHMTLNKKKVEIKDNKIIENYLNKLQ